MSLRSRLVAVAVTVALAGTPVLVGSPASAVPPVIASIDAAATKTGETGDLVLAWHQVTGATTYRVEIADAPSFSPANILVTQTTAALRWVPTTPLWGTTGERDLYWRVVPDGVGANSADATVNAFFRGAAPVPTITSPTAAQVVSYPQPVTFRWAAARGASSYTVTYGLDGSATPTVVTGLLGTSYTPAAALPNGSYTVSVRASFPTPTYAGEYSGGTSDSQTFSVAWSDSAPTLTSPADHTVANDLEFTWAPVTGAAKYLVEIARDDSFTADNMVLTSEVPGTTFIPTNVLPSTTYFWRVSAYTVNGESSGTSAPWQVRKIMSDDDESVPPADSTTFTPSFTNIGTSSANATVLDYDSFKLTWTPVPRATYYHVVVNRNGQNPISCNTASTEATIVASATATGNNTTALSGSSDCLWNTNQAMRIQPNNDVYIATVQAVNMSASSAKAFGSSDPDDADVVPTAESAPHYFRIAPGTATETVDAVVVNPIPASTTEVAPTLSWQPVSGADAYIVTFYADTARSSKIGEIRTTTPLVRPTGVFVRNLTTTDSYVAVVRAATGSTSSSGPSSWLYLTDVGEGVISWRRTGDTPPAGTVDYRGGTAVLQMTPTAKTALSGANRGYAVNIYPQGSDTKVAAPLKVDQPSTVAASKFTTSASTFKATSLPAGNYTFTWSVLDPSGNAGEESPKVPFSVGRSSATSLTSVVDGNGTAATLTWLNGDAARKYSVSFGKEGATPTKYAVTTRGITVQNLTPGITYAWSVTSEDKDGNVSTASPTATFSIAQRVVTLASDTLTAVPARTATISWSPVTGASRYLVRVAETTKGLTSATAVETTSLSYVPTVALKYGTPYAFDVRAVPETLLKSSTRPVIAATPTLGQLTVVTAPGAPISIGTSVVAQTISVSWTAPTGAAQGSAETPGHTVRYRIVRTDGLENAWTTVVVGSAVTRKLSGLKAGTSYEIQVAAGNSQGQGPWSRSVTAKTADTTPKAPKLTSLSRGDRTALARWSAPTDGGSRPITGYLLQKRSYASGKWSGWTSAGSAVATSRSLTVTSLVNGLKYEVRVSAKSAAGAGAWSTGALVTPAGKPKAPTSVKVSAAKSKTKVSWAKAVSNGSSITSYKVQSSTNGTKWTTIKTVKSTATSYTWTKAKKGKKYYFRVLATNALGTSTPSAKVKVVAK
ncbi:fibronectin type III domain-containing protein [Cellulomonas sp. PhB150]|uniref:fibronectin type III domain-containing protein n=1 Tax=Cellulomonas sp. PhB150 TaxID=2485188 RepID=UPI000F8FE8BC|nr:fibronectin type III domain-containing protein [Cellulomonas sp. PhB150]ROS30686.1 fibronectin type III domain protein [Cellulomonas sp. PhB150]